jgi:hypothetical protein
MAPGNSDYFSVRSVRLFCCMGDIYDYIVKLVREYGNDPLNSDEYNDGV